ncbi:MAG: TIGR01777 family protein [Candidatus Omnitrophica bacterium]|nr:TIGR01777 family protein [Candidatus Omnitrophota bacterium]
MRILVSGTSGLVGSALVRRLEGEGHEAVRLVRHEPQPGAGEIFWNPKGESIDRAELEGLDAVVHLAGENIATGKWTQAKKDLIRDSRVRGTRLIARALGRLNRPPSVWVSASAIGFYGNRGADILTERSAVGRGYLAETCQEWEAATEQARHKGIRVVLLRIGLVLTPQGGALAKLVPPFRLGLGGPLGSGRQYMSWITLEDLVGVMLHAIKTGSIQGPLNAVSPQPVMNKEFSRVLGRVLFRPALLPAPAFMLRLLLGEFADEILLASTRVKPARLEETAYRFQHPDLEEALRHLLTK